MVFDMTLPSSHFQSISRLPSIVHKARLRRQIAVFAEKRGVEVGEALERELIHDEAPCVTRRSHVAQDTVDEEAV